MSPSFAVRYEDAEVDQCELSGDIPNACAWSFGRAAHSSSQHNTSSVEEEDARLGNGNGCGLISGLLLCLCSFSMLATLDGGLSPLSKLTAFAEILKLFLITLSSLTMSENDGRRKGSLCQHLVMRLTSAGVAYLLLGISGLDPSA